MVLDMEVTIFLIFLPTDSRTEREHLSAADPGTDISSERCHVKRG